MLFIDWTKVKILTAKGIEFKTYARVNSFGSIQLIRPDKKPTPLLRSEKVTHFLDESDSFTWKEYYE